jgi:hypothetical protein
MGTAIVLGMFFCTVGLNLTISKNP